jgi:membrane protein implicated in regulation of membrane protease activity
MTLEVWYWVALGVGVGFLLLSLVFGDLFDFVDIDLGDGFAATPVFFTIVAAFGGGGLLAIEAFDASAGMSAVAGLATGVGAGGLAAAFFKVLGRQESREGFSISQLVGERGRCTLAIRPGKEGRVAIQSRGMTRTITATSDTEVAVGDEVVVLDAIGNSIKVARTDERTPR